MPSPASPRRLPLSRFPNDGAHTQSRRSCKDAMRIQFVSQRARSFRNLSWRLLHGLDAARPVGYDMHDAKRLGL